MTRIKKTIILIGAAAMVAFSFSSCATTNCCGTYYYASLQPAKHQQLQLENAYFDSNFGDILKTSEANATADTRSIDCRQLISTAGKCSPSQHATKRNAQETDNPQPAPQLMQFWGLMTILGGQGPERTS